MDYLAADSCFGFQKRNSRVKRVDFCDLTSFAWIGFCQRFPGSKDSRLRSEKVFPTKREKLAILDRLRLFSMADEMLSDEPADRAGKPLELMLGARACAASGTVD